MAAAPRPRRSVLYMPGSNARALEKGRNLPADGLILDLEDAVAPDAKDSARDQIVSALAEGGYGKREIQIRTNGLNTPWGHADIVAAAKTSADAILLPKVESADTVRQVANIMAAEGAHEDMRIWCMMETPLAMLNAKEIAGAHPKLGGFVMGTSDLAKDLNCAHTPDRLPMITSLGLCILAARAFGLAILDGVHLDLSDDDGFAASCQQGRDMGFDGKTLIHPKTIGAANTAFAPSEADVAWARKIIAAFEQAASEGKGVVVVDGKLIENLHVVSAQKLVTMADLIGEMDGA
ncbi:HpcH/HpaI aldolase/citrate lyase family protein [Thalassospira lucentensis]|uniref:HpcH/HpaI aldolase/citrate lyase family protein n=1 Tax=Thalassospira lucentensis TaxID=168935 RepID=UPI0003B55805|nr:CoA ester lyase [Thalassospira lucentensis]RCK28856.1 malyl-CoA thiolesterase [Thalassospira lucentensis MCCC 1A00383 = DSM 14000]